MVIDNKFEEVLLFALIQSENTGSCFYFELILLTYKAHLKETLFGFKTNTL
jgi:hypothetical protein